MAVRIGGGGKGGDEVGGRGMEGQSNEKLNKKFCGFQFPKVPFWEVLLIRII